MGCSTAVESTGVKERAIANPEKSVVFVVKCSCREAMVPMLCNILFLFVPLEESADTTVVPCTGSQ